MKMVNWFSVVNWFRPMINKIIILLQLKSGKKCRCVCGGEWDMDFDDANAALLIPNCGADLTKC